MVELVYAAERTMELALDEDITNPDIRTVPTETPTEGIGSVEAPRGTLTHHYVTDERGVLQKVNLIVGTTNNHASISMSIRLFPATRPMKSRIECSALNPHRSRMRASWPGAGAAAKAERSSPRGTTRILSRG